MNYLRTAILLAGLTALFTGVGYLIGGATGALLALVVAGGMNLFAYWNADRLVLSMHGAQEVDERTAPRFVGLVRQLAARAGLPMPRAIFGDTVGVAAAMNRLRMGKRTTKPGTVPQWLQLFTMALEVREKYSKIVGLWATEAPQVNEVCHIWAYPDLNTRAAVRAEVAKDLGWQEFLKSSTGLLEEMHSTVMLPAPHSPLK